MSSESQPGYKGEPSDEDVEAFIDAHPDGANDAQIAEALGMTRARVGQICSKALAKALRNATVRGMMAPEFSELGETQWDKMRTS